MKCKAYIQRLRGKVKEGCSHRERGTGSGTHVYWALSVEFLGIPRLKPDWSIKTINKRVLVNSAVSYIMDVNGGRHRSWEARETLYHKGH